MFNQQELYNEFKRPIDGLGATDPVTATDLRNVLARVASILAPEPPEVPSLGGPPPVPEIVQQADAIEKAIADKYPDGPPADDGLPV